jgi:hypothetical protein
MGFTEGTRVCTGEDTRVYKRFDIVPYPLADNDPWPTKWRGWYFNGADHYIPTTELLHHTGQIDALLQPRGLSTTRVIFSRNRNVNTMTNYENFFKFYFTSNARLSIIK